MRGGAFFNGKEGRVDFRKTVRKSISFFELFNMKEKNMTNYNDIQIIIMAGGVGSRFCPMSPPRLPKAVHRCDGSRPFPYSIDCR